MERLMDLAGFLASLETSGLSNRLKDSLYLFPLTEATHVVGLAVVFGTIMIVDLRLLGLASVRRPFSRITSDVLKWTWMAFALTVVTGLLMFITNATVYYHNFYFRAKMVTLALAGINMVIFELTTGRTAHRWDKDTAAPRAGKAAAALSLLLWTGVIFWGRWIGFTTAQSAPPIDTQEINLDDLFAPESSPAEPEEAQPESTPAP
jgi:hypothetical protein